MKEKLLNLINNDNAPSTKLEWLMAIIPTSTTTATVRLTMEIRWKNKLNKNKNYNNFSFNKFDWFLTAFQPIYGYFVLIDLEIVYIVHWYLHFFCSCF